MVSYRILWQSKEIALGVTSRYDHILVWIGITKSPDVIPVTMEALRELKEAIQPAIETFLKATATHQLEVMMGELSFGLDMISRTATSNRVIPDQFRPSTHEVETAYDQLVTLLRSFTERYQG